MKRNYFALYLLILFANDDSDAFFVSKANNVYMPVMRSRWLDDGLMGVVGISTSFKSRSIKSMSSSSFHEEETINDDDDRLFSSSLSLEENTDREKINSDAWKMNDVGEREDKVGGYNAEERLGMKGTREVMLGEPKGPEKEYSVSSILKELAAIQQQGPQKYCVLGTRHCSFLHQQIIELLAYALVLSGNHVFTSGAGGTHAAAIKGALRAERPDLLTVVLPQSLVMQSDESQKLLEQVVDIIEMPQNDKLSLDVASRMCNSFLLSRADQLIAFAFHESTTVIEATREARKNEMLVTTLFLD